MTKYPKGRVPMEQWRDFVFTAEVKKDSVFVNTLPEIDSEVWDTMINTFIASNPQSQAFVMAAPTWLVGYERHTDAVAFYNRLEKLWDKEDRGWAPAIMLIHRSPVQPGAFLTPKRRPGKWNGKPLSEMRPVGRPVGR